MIIQKLPIQILQLLPAVFLESGMTRDELINIILELSNLLLNRYWNTHRTSTYYW